MTDIAATSRALTSTSRLGRASYVVFVALSLGGLAAGTSAAVTGRYERLILAAILVVMSLVLWGTRVRTVTHPDRVVFRQLGKTLEVRFDDVASCTPHRDGLGLGAGLRWLGRGQWVMLSGDSFCDIAYGRGRSLLVSHRDADRLSQFLTSAA